MAPRYAREMKLKPVLFGVIVGAVAAASVTACGSTNLSPATTKAAPTTTIAPETPSSEITATTAPETTAPETTAASGKGTLASPIPLGTSADVGDGWTLKIVAYNPNANTLVAKANQFNDKAPAGKVYVMFTVEMGYNGDKDKDSAFFSLKAVGTSKTSYSETAVPPEPAFDYFKDVFKGSTTSGNIALLVDSSDAAGLIAYGSVGFGDDDVYFATS